MTLKSRPIGAIVAMVGAVTALRVIILFLSPLELYPDEAQYWVWSRHLAFGYFSKPPLIAWLIRLTTALGGQTEPWVRLSAPILHGLTAVVLGLAGRRLYGTAAGWAAAALYTLSPGVQLSCAVIATDAPLMLCLSLALWTYSVWWTTTDASERRLAAAAFGLSLGAAFLAKYAAIYFLGSVIAHVVVSRDARTRWRPADLTLAILLFAAMASPNVIWNALHHFQTVAHTAADANLNDDSSRPSRWFDPRGAVGYVVGQFGVFGPIPFAAFLIGAFALARRKALTAEDRLLLIFAAPPLLIVLGEAVVSRANANWAGAAYGPAAIFVGAVLIRGRRWRVLGAALASQTLIAAIFLAVFAHPALADKAGFANSFKRARGWSASTKAVETAARDAGAPLTAVAVDDRFLFNALSYYGRDARNRPAGALAAPLRSWVREARPHNQAETTAPLVESPSARVLIANVTAVYRPEIMADFGRIEPGAKLTSIRLDKGHRRDIALFVGDSYRRRPRDPITGRPKRP